MKPFERWETEEVVLTFGVKKVEDHPTLLTWLAATETIDDEEMKVIERLRLKLKRKSESWNEDEIKFFFISQLLDMINFNKEGA